MITKTEYVIQIDVSYDSERQWIPIDYLSVEEAAVISTRRARLAKAVATYPTRDARLVKVERVETVLEEHAWNL